MKYTKKIFVLILSIILILSFLVGCASNKSYDSNDSSPEFVENSAADRDNGSSFENKDTSDNEDEKIITNGYLSFETTDFDKTHNTLDNLVQKYKAYIEDSEISYNNYHNNKNYRYGHFTIRIPKDNLSKFTKEFVKELEEVGHMISENTNKENVTKEYKDIESRLKVINTKEERILSLLEKAEKMEDIIALENQLSEIIYEKERLQSNLINIDHKVDYSTLSISIDEVDKLSNIEYKETGFGIRIKNALSNSLYEFKKSIENLIIALIYFFPFGIVIAIMIFLGYKFVYLKYFNKK